MTTEPRATDTRWQRLRRHGAFQVAVIFASAAWLGIQAADVFGLSTTLVRILGIVMLAVFVVLTVYAWVDTRESDPARRASAKSRRRWYAVSAAAIALLLLGGGAWLLKPRLFGDLKPGADVIAVLPFNTSGASVSLLGEGLVDLLSTNLNEVGRIRTIDPRTTLHRWKQAATDGSMDLEGALAVGRAVGAGSVLLGSVVEAGGTVRISAELVGVDGDRLATVENEGAADDVFALVDALSVDLLRDIWNSREPLPELRLSAITTSSPDALRTYLRGEQYFRRSQWDSAGASFEQAVLEDSTFALAHFRIAEVYGWREGLGAESARSHAEAAARFAERLPTPERSLVTAHLLHENGDLAAIDTLRSYVARYPDDAAGWHMLGDAMHHAWTLLGVALEELYRPFDRTLELDSSFAPALLHPLETAIISGDSSRFRRYIEALENLDVERQAGFFRALGAIRWSPPERRLDAVGSAHRFEGVTGGNRFLIVRVHTAAVMSDEVPRFDELKAGFDTARVALPAGAPMRTGLYVTEGITAASMGHLRAATAILDTLRRVNAELPFSVVLPIHALAQRPIDFGRKELEEFLAMPGGRDSHTLRYWKVVFSHIDGDSARARRVLDEARGLADSAYAPVFDALAGFARMAAGDTAAVISGIESDLRRAGYSGRAANFVNGLRVFLAMAQTRLPETRDEGLEHLRSLSTLEPMFVPLLAPVLAEAYERDGQTEEAARVWAGYIAVLEQADPEMRPHLEAARRSLASLAGERRTPSP